MFDAFLKISTGYALVLFGAIYLRDRRLLATAAIVAPLLLVIAIIGGVL